MVDTDALMVWLELICIRVECEEGVTTVPDWVYADILSFVFSNQMQ